jgi:hypothetical protein
LETEILTQEIALLYDKLNPNSPRGEGRSKISTVKLLQLHSCLKHSVCNFYFEMAIAMNRLFDASLYESKEELSFLFKEKEKEISSIHFNFK